VVDDAAMSPFGGYVIDAKGDLVTTAETVADASLAGHVEVLREFFSSKAVVDIDVRRRDGDLKVDVTVSEDAPESVVRHVMSRAAGVLREYDRYAPRIDVAVRRAS
jgi:hypothetical protein